MRGLDEERNAGVVPVSNRRLNLLWLQPKGAPDFGIAVVLHAGTIL